MRVHILALAAFSVTGLAHAASVDSIKTGMQKTTSSIEIIHCAKCFQEAKKKVAPVAIELAPGTQKVEIRNVGGVMKVYRTEAWLGGSPVVVVSKASDTQIAEQVVDAPTEKVAVKVDKKPAEQPVALGADMIDESATTAAVTADMGAAVKVAPKKAAFDASKLELRLD
jgi:hypothetical protein